MVPSPVLSFHTCIGDGGTDGATGSPVNTPCQTQVFAYPSSHGQKPLDKVFRPASNRNDQPMGPVSGSDYTQNILRAHVAIRKSGLPNYKGCRIPVETKVNVAFIERELANYEDNMVSEFIKFGFPPGMIGELTESIASPNHRSALQFPAAMDSYVSREVEEGAILGPFDNSPFTAHTIISPLSTTEKCGSDERRVIMDLSYPPGTSVNDRIPRNEYLGDPINLTYPKIDDLVELVKAKGRNCLLFKRYLKRVYHQFQVDMGYINALGFSWNDKMYFDLSLPMGMRTSALCCQRVTNAIRFMYNRLGFDLVPYLDDL